MSYEVQLANGFSLSLGRFVVRGFSEKRPRLFGDVFRFTAFSGLRNVSTFAGYCRAGRNAGPTCAESDRARSTDA